MRNRFLVSYDVRDDRRLSRVHRKLSGFGQWVQYSVFMCDLTATSRVLLEAALTEILNLIEDRVLIVDLGPVDGRGKSCIKTLGRAQELPTHGPVVV